MDTKGHTDILIEQAVNVEVKYQHGDYMHKALATDQGNGKTCDQDRRLRHCQLPPQRSFAQPTRTTRIILLEPRN